MELMREGTPPEEQRVRLPKSTADDGESNGHTNRKGMRKYDSTRVSLYPLSFDEAMKALFKTRRQAGKEDGAT
jgi:hypothetical protein